ncbi:MAG: hypothetical protein ABSA97_05755 [Verrucomicrobiia bacterium]
MKKSLMRAHLMPAMRAKQEIETMVAPRRAAGDNPAMAGRMPCYISQHAIACLTRQALQAIIAELKRDKNGEIHPLRVRFARRQALLRI